MIPSSETAPSEELRKDPGTACPNVLAVDFGTATTYICKCPGDRLSPQGLLLRGDRDGVASVLLYRQDRDPLVGDEALEEFGEAPEAERRAYALRAQFKPDIARGNDAAEYARDFLAGLLREARRQHLDMEPEGREVLFGVPSEADDTFRATLTRIAREAGYGDIHTVDEPLALWCITSSTRTSPPGMLSGDFLWWILAAAPATSPFFSGATWCPPGET